MEKSCIVQKSVSESSNVNKPFDVPCPSSSFCPFHCPCDSASSVGVNSTISNNATQNLTVMCKQALKHQCFNDHTFRTVAHGHHYVTGIVLGLGQAGVLCKCYVIITVDHGSPSTINVTKN